MPMAVPTTRMISRPTMPSSIDTPAKPDAMPVANGLIVEPRTPMPQPEQEDRRADERVVAGRDHDRDDQRVEGQALLGHPERRPAEGEDGHQDRDHPAARGPCSRATMRAIPPWIAPVVIVTPRNPPMTRMNRATSMAPNSSPEFQTLMLPSCALDAVQAVDRRHQRVDDDPLRVRRRRCGRCPGSARRPRRGRRRRPG